MATLFRMDGWVKSAVGPATPGASIYVCNQPANTVAPIQVPNGPPLPPFVPSPLASIFSDVNGLVPITQPIITDGFGHYNFYASAGFYTVVVMLGGRVQQAYADQNVGEAAAAVNTVSSVFGRTGAVVAQNGDYSVSQISGAAPIASPGFLGIPTAPTAAPGTNTTQLATTAFVIANAGSAPVTSVFGRIGAVVATSGDYSVGQVTGAAPTASPTFTGTPAAPTAAPGTNTTQLATTAFVTAAVASGGAVSSVFGRTGAVTAQSGDYTVGQITGAAPTASPTFTGTPAAPTAAPGTNTTQLATTAFVAAAVTAGGGVNSVFGRTGTVTAQSGDYSVGQITGAAPTASPTFTGTPVAPTAAPGTNTTQLATTAFVQAAVTGLGSGTVTSVSFTGGLISVANPTSTPALTVAGTSGGIPFFSSASTWATSAALAAGGVVLGGGAGTTPATNTQLVFSGSTLTIGLASSGTGILAFKGTTSGVISMKGQNAAGTYNFNLPTTAGSAGQVLTSQGGGATAMTWTTIGTGTVSTGVTGQLAFYSSSTVVAGQTDVTAPTPGTVVLGSNGGNPGSFSIVAGDGTTSNMSVNANNGLSVTTGAKFLGIVEITGNKVLTTQFDKTSSTVLSAAMTSDTLVSSFTYRFRAVLHVTMGAGGGCQWAVASDGALTVTNFVQQNTVMNNTAATLTVSRQTTLGTATSLAATPTSACIVVEGAFVVNAPGSVVLQFAQATSNGTPSSILIGSTFEVWCTNG